MKNIIVTLSLFLPFICFSQQRQLPKFYIVNGDTLGITISMEQLKRMKNDLELKTYLEASAVSCDSFMNKAIIAIDDCEGRVRVLKLRIDKLDSADHENRVLLDNCLQRLENGDKDRFLCESQRKNDSIMINNMNKQINTLKVEKLVGWWGSGTFMVVSIILGIILAVH